MSKSDQRVCDYCEKAIDSRHPGVFSLSGMAKLNVGCSSTISGYQEHKFEDKDFCDPIHFALWLDQLHRRKHGAIIKGIALWEHMEVNDG